MKPTRSQMKELLGTDEDKVLNDTWSEYSEDDINPNGNPNPPENREQLIEDILDMMEREGDVTLEPNEFFKLSDLAREMNVDPKVARDKYRKALVKGNAPESSSPTGWVFELKQKPIISSIIQPRRKT